MLLPNYLIINQCARAAARDWTEVGFAAGVLSFACTDEVSQDLSPALANLKAKTAFCQECFNITEAGRERCEICESLRRDGSLICVVEEALDVLALERTGGFQGKYHVLQGVYLPSKALVPTT